MPSKKSAPCKFCPDKAGAEATGDKKKKKKNKEKDHTSSPALSSAVQHIMSTSATSNATTTEWWSRYNTLQPMFTRAAQLVRHLRQQPSDDELLQLYGLFKQVTLGDAPPNSSAALWDIKQKRKDAAWQQYRGVDQVDAMQSYVDLVSTLSAKYQLSHQPL